ncbi:MAG: riboflavin synthase [Acidimicrobiia bacterium]
MLTGIVEEPRRRARHPRQRRWGAHRDRRHRAHRRHHGRADRGERRCLTVVGLGDGWWAADAVTETFDRTALGALTAGSPVNLERPMAADGRFGGHVAVGHVDGVGTLTARAQPPDGSTRMTFTPPPALVRYVVEKGSITIDGISLTVAPLDDAAGTFDVAVIPHTLSVTTLGARQLGDPVNLEVDVLAKYVERLLTAPRGEAHSE